MMFVRRIVKAIGLRLLYEELRKGQELVRWD